MDKLDSAEVGALEDFGRGQDADAEALGKKMKWLSSAFGKKENFLSLIKYLITEAPEKALPFKGKIIEIAMALRAKDQSALDDIVEDQYDQLIEALVDAEVEIPPDPKIANQPATSG